MKKYFVAVLLCLFALIGFLSGKADLDIFAKKAIQSTIYRSPSVSLTKSTYVRDKVSLFRTIGETSCEILLVGDSLIDNGNWDELISHRCTANRGIQGITTLDVLELLPIVDLVQSSTVVLMIGTNDVRRGLSFNQFTQNYTEIVNHILKQSDLVLLTSLLQPSVPQPNLSGKIDQINDFLSKLASSNDHIRYIDLNAELSVDGTLSKQVSEDGIHLNGLGYLSWLNLINRELH